jgi:hypothetical protein
MLRYADWQRIGCAPRQSSDSLGASKLVLLVGDILRTEEVLMLESIKEAIDDAERNLVLLTDIAQGLDHETVNDNIELATADSNLSFYIEKAYRELGILAERLNAPQFAAEIHGERKKGLKKGKFSETELNDWGPGLVSPSLGRVRSYYSSLGSMIGIYSTTARDVLERLLKNTGRLIHERGLDPKSEADVRNAIIQVLQLAFDGVQKDIPLPQSVKTYKGDIGIPAVASIIEYKYVKSKQDMKNALDGIYADMKGYSRVGDWRSFYAVFYMSGPFYLQEDVEEEFAIVGADKSWTPIVVQGPAGQKPKPPKRT